MHVTLDLIDQNFFRGVKIRDEAGVRPQQHHHGGQQISDGLNQIIAVDIDVCVNLFARCNRQANECVAKAFFEPFAGELLLKMLAIDSRQCFFPARWTRARCIIDAAV